MCIFVLFANGQHNNKDYAKRITSRHYFSSLARQDTFTLNICGPNLFESTVLFQIISWKGSVIYRHQFTIGDLMERDYTKDARSKEDSSSIIKTLDHFFEESQFHPAYTDLSDVTNEHYWGLGKEWKEFRHDTTSIGFHYLLGAEDGRNIGFSKRRNKAVVYLKCC